jgi:hypothetical protein
MVACHMQAGVILRNLRCAIRFWTLRLSLASVMEDQSSSPASPSDVCGSFDWVVLGLRYDMVLPLMVTGLMFVSMCGPASKRRPCTAVVA